MAAVRELRESLHQTVRDWEDSNSADRNVGDSAASGSTGPAEQSHEVEQPQRLWGFQKEQLRRQAREDLNQENASINSQTNLIDNAAVDRFLCKLSRIAG